MKDVLVEMIRQGAYLKCTAVDPDTGEEAIAVGPAKAPEAVRALAITKLKAKLAGRGGRG
jgi:hypothetical protein